MVSKPAQCYKRRSSLIWGKVLLNFTNLVPKMPCMFWQISNSRRKGKCGPVIYSVTTFESLNMPTFSTIHNIQPTPGLLRWITFRLKAKTESDRNPLPKILCPCDSVLFPNVLWNPEIVTLLVGRLPLAAL